MSAMLFPMRRRHEQAELTPTNLVRLVAEIRSAAALNERTAPWSSMVMMPSAAVSRMARNRASFPADRFSAGESNR